MSPKKARSIKAKAFKTKALPPKSVAKEPFFPKPRRKRNCDWKPNPSQQESPKKLGKSFSKAVAQAVPQAPTKPTRSLAEVRRARYAREKLRKSNKDFNLDWDWTKGNWNVDRQIKKEKQEEKRGEYKPIPKKKRPLLKAPPSNLLQGFKFN